MITLRADSVIRSLWEHSGLYQYFKLLLGWLIFYSISTHGLVRVLIYLNHGLKGSVRKETNTLVLSSFVLIEAFGVDPNEKLLSTGLGHLKTMKMAFRDITSV